MAPDPAVVAAIQAAVDADPANPALRSHLAHLLVGAGEHERALGEATQVLAVVPDDRGALAAARDAARLLGDDARAAAYGRLLASLDGHEPADPAPRPVVPPELRPGGDGERPGRGAPGDGNRPGGSAPDRDPPARLRAGGEDGPGAEDDEEAETAQRFGDRAHARERVTLEDVGGMAAVKERLELAFLGPLRHPELRELYGKSLRGGLLLFGPPGCGKTYLARAVAGELGAAFFSLGLSDVLDMYLGESERRLHELFEAARRAAPCVVFLDEADALGQKRSQLRSSAGRNVVNQLLSELDGVEADNEGVFILAATNHPWDVDGALRRPGRLDRTLLVLPPDAPARATILRGALAGRPTEDAIDVDALAARTELCSGADLVHLVDGAAELAIADALKSGTARPITGKDLRKAAKSLRPSTRAWFTTAYNYALYANDDGVYDELLAYVREHRLS